MAKKNKITKQNLYKYLAVYFAALDCFVEAHAVIESTVFYRHGLKQAGERLMKEVESVHRQIAKTEGLSDVAYNAEWIEMKKIVRVYLEAVELTDIENINELLEYVGNYINEKYNQNGSTNS